MRRAIFSASGTPIQSGPKLPPRLEGGLPLLGHALEFNNNPVRLLERARVLYGDLCTVAMPGTDAIIDRSDLTLEDLRSMPKLEATIKEVLRMYPPIIVMMRKVVNDFSFGGYDFPHGSMIFASPAVSHSMPELFPNPHQFDPKRFMDPNNADKKNPMAWIPFGAGRRRCMGIVFAQLQLRALWSHLRRHFDFETVDGDVYEPDYSRLLVGPRHPCRLRYRRRKLRTSVAA